MLIHGNGENKEENTDQQALDFINNDKTDIDRSHKIGRYDEAKKKARPIRAKFARYNARGRVFFEKRKKGKVQEKVLLEALQQKELAN